MAKYKRVPVFDIIEHDANISQSSPRRYDWIGVGDKAVELAKKKNGKDRWLLVDEDGATSIASNITSERIVPLTGERFLGWKFRGRSSDITYKDDDGNRLTSKRGRIWIQATRSAVDV